MPQINQQPKHMGHAVKEKVAKPIYLKPEEALLTASYRNPDAKFSPPPLKQRGDSCLFAHNNLTAAPDQQKIYAADRFLGIYFLGYGEILKLLLQSRRKYKFTATIY
ncbi:hypothetical protein BTVI_49528 [Pitangus sulphuratus]|nr:hypothetical protein BTVI_49528 [Pitangus sulphuratus]